MIRRRATLRLQRRQWELFFLFISHYILYQWNNLGASPEICAGVQYNPVLGPEIPVFHKDERTGFGRCKNTRLMECINMENITEVPDVMIVFTRCGETNFSIHKSKIPAVALDCDPETKYIDCKESVPMLNFLINTYDAPLAKKYIFAHGHDLSWHYMVNFFDVLEELMGTNYFSNREFGGVYNGRDSGSCGWKESSWANPLYKWVYHGTSMPEKPTAVRNYRPCCSTFWMNSTLVHTRQKWEYVVIRDRLRQWSREHMNITRGPAYYCGRTMEYTWHILLFNESYIDQCKECKLTK